jgi:hypothetical protein
LMSSHCLSETDRQAIGYLHDLVNYSSAFTCQPVLGWLLVAPFAR